MCLLCLSNGFQLLGLNLDISAVGLLGLWLLCFYIRSSMSDAGWHACVPTQTGGVHFSAIWLNTDRCLPHVFQKETGMGSKNRTWCYKILMQPFYRGSFSSSKCIQMMSFAAMWLFPPEWHGARYAFCLKRLFSRNGIKFLFIILIGVEV